jgi:UPF0755 protein
MNTPPISSPAKIASSGSIIPPPRRRRYYRWVLAASGAGLLSALIFLAVAVNRYRTYISSPEPNLTAVTLVEITPGMSFRAATERLHKEGVVSSKLFFLLLARARQVTTRVQAGEYTFKPGMDPTQVLDLITHGDVTVWELRVPEGLTIFEIARRLSELGPWSEELFLALATDPDRTEEAGIPVASMEGYLFPAHYFLRLSMTEDEVLMEMLTRGFRERTKERLARAEELGLSWHQVLTLASMVEKEAMIRDEMPDIASVFVNRLKLDMKLQCDPTAVYGLQDFAAPITK